MMQKEIPYKRILRLALITTPLFGLFGATPALVIANVEASRIPIGFMMVTLLTSLFWLINISLLRINQKALPSKSNLLRYAISILLVAFLLVSLSTLLFSHGIYPIEIPKEIPLNLIPKRIFIFPLIQAESINIITIILLEVVLLQDQKLQIQNENNLLKVANLEAKHSNLKQQLHPHFLFNSLSTLRSLIKRSPEQAEEYLEKLSAILRSSIQSETQTTVPLTDELSLGENYLLMQQVRFGNALHYQIDIPDSMHTSSKVPAYSIQLLVENAIKHNILTTNHPLHLQITGDLAQKTISVKNNLQPKQVLDESNGFGLANLSERYKLLGTDAVQITKTEEEFKVTIKAITDDSSNY
jgi:two-component system, LytTR family, sensor kinase